MILGIVVSSLLFLVFVVFGTLFICGKGYFFISGYRTLTDAQKELFVSKNNLKKVFTFYSYYCYAVALVTLVALVGVLVNSMVIIFVCYLVFSAGTVAAMIIVNANSAYKINPIDVSIMKSTPVVNPEQPKVEKVELDKVEEPAPVKKTPAKKATPKTTEKPAEEKVEEKVEEKPAETNPVAKKPATKKAPAKKTTTKKAE